MRCDPLPRCVLSWAAGVDRRPNLRLLAPVCPMAMTTPLAVARAMKSGEFVELGRHGEHANSAAGGRSELAELFPLRRAAMRHRMRSPTVVFAEVGPFEMNANDRAADLGILVASRGNRAMPCASTSRLCVVSVGQMPVTPKPK